MFRFFRKLRIRKYIKESNQYVQETYIEPKKRFEARYSIADDESTTISQDSKKNTPNSGVMFSICDDYDEVAIMRTMKEMNAATPPSKVLSALDEYMNMTFVDKMLEHINKRHMRDTDVYKAAQIDRRLFSKIVSDREYKPAKDTCIAFAFALQLTLTEAEDLLSRAGYILSHSNKRDVVIEYFFKEQIHDLTDINEVLYRLDQKVIGRT